MTLITSLAGTDIELLADRAIGLPSHRAVIVADVHWGKAAAFRANGVPIPHGTTRTGLDRLSTLIERTGATHLFVLGDLVHARGSLSPASIETIRQWRAAHAAVDITLIRGNHDYNAGDPPASLQINCVDAPLRVGPFALCHHPAPHEHGYVLAGHVHPVVQLRGRGRQKLTLPCFAFGARVGLLPAFGEFTGGHVIDQRDFAAVHVIAEEAVVSLPSTAEGQAPYVTPG